MSNVIKYGRVFLNQEDKKVIDSNDKGGFTQISFRDSERISVGGSPELLEDHPKETEEEIDPEAFLMEERENFLREAEEILQNARDEAAKILEDAREEGKRLEAQAVEAGKTYGHQEGLKLAEFEIQKIKQDLLEEGEKLKQQYEEEFSRLEPVMVELTSGLIANITGVLMEERADVIVHLVKRALSQVKRNDSFIVKVGREDYAKLVPKRNELLECVGETKSLELEEDEGLSAGQCMIETDDRIVDCGMDTQLNGLFENLKLLSRC